MNIEYYCFICNEKCIHSLDFMQKKLLFLNSDNNRKHNPIGIICSNILQDLLVKQCFINPFDKRYGFKPKIFQKTIRKKGLDKWI